MILIVHIIFGAAIATLFFQNPALAILLSFVSHYFLDIFPHVEYSIEKLKINKKQIKGLLPIIRVFLDFFLGLFLIILLTYDNLLIYVCGLTAALPDFLTALMYLFPKNKFLQAHYNFHQLIHFFDDKHGTKSPNYFNQLKISNFWRVLTQIIVIIISVFIFQPILVQAMFPFFSLRIP
jgi:hypothetical protein